MSDERVLDIDLEIANRGIPQSWQNTYRRGLSGSRPAAVKCLCGECQGWEDGARQAIRDCPSVGCPLHAVRPFQKKASKEIDSESGIDNDNVGDDDTAEMDPDVLDLKEAIRESLKAAARKPEPIVNPSADLDAVKAKILDHLHRKGESARGYIIFSTGIPEALWSEAIRSLLTEGAIEREGEKRNTRYRLKENAQ